MCRDESLKNLLVKKERVKSVTWNFEGSVGDN